MLLMPGADIGQLSPDGMFRWDGTAWRPTAEPYVPAPLPPWASVKLRGQASWLMLAAALLIGLVADQALRTGTFGLAASVAIALIALALLVVGRVSTLSARVLAVGGIAFAVWFTLRASPWLLWPDLAASLILLGFSASFAWRGSLADIGVAELAARAVHAALNGLSGSAFVARPLIQARTRLATAAPIARGLLIATPIALVLGLLLAAADPVFASFFQLNVDLGQLTLDAFFVIAGSVVAAGLLRLAAAEPISRVDGPKWRLGAIEGLIVLVVLDAIFAAFAVAQGVAAFGAAARTLQAAGVTYADYARSGFFQLLWVAGITAVVIILFSRITSLTDPRSRRSFVVLTQIAIVLTLLIVFVASRRLSLYEEAFGFTMLRLYSHIFAVWIGVVFIFLAADIAGVHPRRRWFAGATLMSAAVVLLALNAVNPEALVVALNVDHAGTAHKIDAGYLVQLSSDAIPTLLASQSALDPGLRNAVVTAACAGSKSYTAPVAAWNLSEADAAIVRHERC